MKIENKMSRHIVKAIKKEITAGVIGWLGNSIIEIGAAVENEKMARLEDFDEKINTIDDQSEPVKRIIRLTTQLNYDIMQDEHKNAIAAGIAMLWELLYEIALEYNLLYVFEEQFPQIIENYKLSI